MSGKRVLVEIQTWHGNVLSVSAYQATDSLVVHRRAQWRGDEHVGYYDDWFVTHRHSGYAAMPVKPERGFRTRCAAESAAKALERRWPHLLEKRDPKAEATQKDRDDIRKFMVRRIKASWARKRKAA